MSGFGAYKAGQQKREQKSDLWPLHDQVIEPLHDFTSGKEGTRPCTYIQTEEQQQRNSMVASSTIESAPLIVIGARCKTKIKIQLQMLFPEECLMR
jgi:hypothetical protein